MTTYDVVVVGAGHNGLVAAALLARQGKKVLVVERRARVGGILDTEEIAPGVRAPGVALTVGRLRSSVVETLDLARHGYRPVVPAARVLAPQADGSTITLWGDPARTAEGLAARSAEDAAAWVAFDSRFRGFARFIRAIHDATPPDLESPSLADAIAGLKLGRAFRRLGTRDGREATRLIPMAVADFLSENLRDPALRGALAFRAIRHTAMGPWSAGTTAVLLADAAEGDDGLAGEATQVIGGPGALAAALAAAASAAGAEIRTGAEVVRFRMRDGRVAGVVLAGGEEIEARAVASAADPKRTLTTLADPVELGPHLRWRAANIRTNGASARVDLVLGGLPRFAGTGDTERIAGRILVVGSVDDLERAHDATKYGALAEAPALEAVIPTLADPTLAPDGTHVLSVLVQGAPFRLRGSWDDARETLGDRVVSRLETVAPGIGALVRARRILTPLDLEREVGLTGGHVLHAEPGLDQWFAWRPLLGHARYRFGLPGLYLCGSGAHAGGGVTGGAGENAAREIAADL